MYHSCWRLLFLLLLGCPISSALGQSILAPRIMPACASASARDNFFAWSHVLRFTLPERDVKFHRGKADVDYVREVIQRKSTSAVMSLWSGPMSFSPDPPSDLVQNSPTYSKRELHATDDSLIGFDSFGVTATGKYWRNTFFAIGVNGMRYENASVEDAAFFDRIIDSVCIVPSLKNAH